LGRRSGEGEEQLLELILIRGALRLWGVEAFLQRGRDYKEACPVERFGDGGELLYNVSAVHILLDRTDDRGELPVGAAQPIHYFALRLGVMLNRDCACRCLLLHDLCLLPGVNRPDLTIRIPPEV
jgi:hypothetical protein